VLAVVRQVASALAFMHRSNRAHNDVKPDNLIWVEDEEGAAQGHSVKIVDFGCARLDQREEPGRNWSLAEGGGHRPVGQGSAGLDQEETQQEEEEGRVLLSAGMSLIAG